MGRIQRKSNTLTMSKRISFPQREKLWWFSHQPTMLKAELTLDEIENVGKPDTSETSHVEGLTKVKSN